MKHQCVVKQTNDVLFIPCTFAPGSENATQRIFAPVEL